MSLDEARLIAHLRESRQLDHIRADTPLFSDGTIDSVGMIDLIMFLETTVGIEVGETDVTLDNFDTVGRIMAYVRTKVGG
jgi:D-alanine--poly(phosphoribitol) ligase subunit 2